MRLLKTSLLLTFAILSLTCTKSGRPSTFFQPAGFDADSRIKSLERQVGYMRSKLGFATYEFEFATPKDKKLIATFKAELDGNLVPELSGIYHIPPTGINQNEEGRIVINFFYPQYQPQPPESPTWELNFSSSGRSGSWTFPCPFLLTPAQSRSTSAGATGLGILEDEQEHKVWQYRISPVGANGSVESDFKYTLTIKLEKVKEGEDLQETKKEDSK